MLQQQTVIHFPGEEALAYYVKQPPSFFLDDSHGLSDESHGRSAEPAVIVTLPAALPESCPDVKAFLAEKLKFFADNDDVYHPKFSQEGAFIFQYNEVPDFGLDKARDALAEVLGVDKPKSVAHSPTDGHLAPEGPYFRVASAIHEAWRLFADDYRAFVVGTVPASTAKDAYTYEPLMASSVSGNELAVAVPSRLYSPKSDSRPLNGLRVTIKDNIHLAGVKTSMGNRAYIDYYGPQTETAEFVRYLIDLGAVIVGKTKLLAFAGSEKPPNQAIDYFPSWNPRGDGYQRPAGSSTGAGVCVSGYPWCDMAVGTDTTGSGREPARATGVQGLRLTGRSISMKGVVPSSEEFDSLAFLTRSLEDLLHFTRVSTGNKLSESLPTKILYPTDWLPYKIDGQQRMNEDFLAAMEQVLGVQHTKVSLTKLWEEFPPVEAQGKSIAEYLENSGFWPMYYDNYHTFDEFRQGYEQKFGKPVYVSPSQGWKWDLGSKVTEEQRAQGVAECEVFRDWVAKHVLTRNDEGHGEAVILLPLGNAKLDYRDIVSGPPSVVKAYEPKYFGSILGLPQIVTPIGQLAYESRISKRQENVPVIATFAGAKGSDVMLVKLAQMVLEKMNKPTSVLTGRECFAPETNGSLNASIPLPKLI